MIYAMAHRTTQYHDNYEKPQPGAQNANDAANREGSEGILLAPLRTNQAAKRLRAGKASEPKNATLQLHRVLAGTSCYFTRHLHELALIEVKAQSASFMYHPMVSVTQKESAQR